MIQFQLIEGGEYCKDADSFLTRSEIRSTATNAVLGSFYAENASHPNAEKAFSDWVISVNPFDRRWRGSTVRNPFRYIAQLSLLDTMEKLSKRLNAGLISSEVFESLVRAMLAGTTRMQDVSSELQLPGLDLSRLAEHAYECGIEEQSFDMYGVDPKDLAPHFEGIEAELKSERAFRNVEVNSQAWRITPSGRIVPSITMLRPSQQSESGEFLRARAVMGFCLLREDDLVIEKQGESFRSTLPKSGKLSDEQHASLKDLCTEQGIPYDSLSASEEGALKQEQVFAAIGVALETEFPWIDAANLFSADAEQLMSQLQSKKGLTLSCDTSTYSKLPENLKSRPEVRQQGGFSFVVSELPCGDVLRIKAHLHEGKVSLAALLKAAK